MNAFVEGVKTLFSGPDTSAQDKQAAKERDSQRIALSRQQQTEQQAAALQDEQAGLAARMPRGRRLLQAATGDSGVATTLGGGGS